MLTRRHFFVLSASFPLLSHAAPNRLAALPAAVEKLEKDNGGRFGVAVLDMVMLLSYRAITPRPICCWTPSAARPASPGLPIPLETRSLVWIEPSWP
jgi:hypothetical protein